jgi:hypothetical protein
MKAPQQPQTPIIVRSGGTPRGQGGITLAHAPLELLKKYSSPKPLRRPPARRLEKR